jgi:hypothetical protein
LLILCETQTKAELDKLEEILKEFDEEEEEDSLPASIYYQSA